MEYRAIGKSETAIVHITGRGLFDRALQVTSRHGERPEHDEQHAQPEQVLSIRDTPGGNTNVPVQTRSALARRYHALSSASGSTCGGQSTPPVGGDSRRAQHHTRAYSAPA